MDEVTKKVLNAFEETVRRQREELHKLCTSPEKFDVAQAIMDSLWGALTCVFNYDYVVDGNGVKRTTLEFVEILQNAMSAEFLKVTGKEYVPEVVRTLRSKRR